MPLLKSGGRRFKRKFMACPLQLVSMVEVFNRLLEANGDQQTDHDGGNVDEEPTPGMDAFVGCVCFKHRRGLLSCTVCGGLFECGRVDRVRLRKTSHSVVAGTLY